MDPNISFDKDGEHFCRCSFSYAVIIPVSGLVSRKSLKRSNAKSIGCYNTDKTLNDLTLLA